MKTLLLVSLLTTVALGCDANEPVVETGSQAETLPAENQPVSFVNIAANDGAGISYRREPSRAAAQIIAVESQPHPLQQVMEAPAMGGGLPGLALADFDGDGALDIYVSNGRDRPSSLYLNQRRTTGSTTFVDVGLAKGCGGSGQEGSGVVTADIDNDGWRDILVLGSRLDHNVLYHNRGRGPDGEWRGCEDWTFLPGSDIAGGKMPDGSYEPHTSATFGDFNNDGLVNVAISVTFNQDENTRPIFWAFDPGIGKNVLLLNMGQGVFHDVTSASGFDRLTGFADRTGPLAPGQTFTWLQALMSEVQTTVPAVPATTSWAIAAVDIDGDGDIDILHFDDEGGMFPASNGGVNFGMIHLMRNVGSLNGIPQFVDDSRQAGLGEVGTWMGSCYADFDSNGRLDLFATNFGTYGNIGFGPFTYQLVGNTDSRAFFGQASGAFSDPGVGALVRSAFGWGASCADLDDDGDTDIVYRGNLDVVSFIEMSNDGSFFLRNLDGTGQFEYETQAFAATSDWRRTTYGVAAGDLDDNGFVDIVTSSPLRLAPGFEKTPFVPFFLPPSGAALDPIAGMFLRMIPTDFSETDPHKIVMAPIYPSDPPILEGTLSVEMNQGNANHWLKVATRGEKGRGAGRLGSVNRDGIGAVVSCTPAGGKKAMYPVMGGASFISQDSTIVSCGLGNADSATIEVRWPGGVRNRRYFVPARARLNFVEIPFSFDDPTLSLKAYSLGVATYLNALVGAHEISPVESSLFFASAVAAYLEAHQL